MEKLKQSFYNELIPVEETKESLLYNIVTGGLTVVNQAVSAVLKSVSDQPHFSISEYAEVEEELWDLHESGFLVDYHTDERAQYQANYIKTQDQKFRNNSHIGLTIGTTILCNMGCPYCFEVVKPNKTLRDEKVIDGIGDYIEGMINTADVQHWSSLSIIWYGGEPLINKEAIEKLSERFVQMSAQYDIPYSASIISNGILLDKDTWQFLKKNQVTDVQITIDGAKEVHNKYRPLKNAKGKNYEKILENLSVMPLGMNATIRVNTDRQVANSLEQLLDDLYSYGIWPQRYDAVSIDLAWLRSYEGADTSGLASLSNEEFFDIRHEFRMLQSKRFNNFAEANGMPSAKVKWHLPSKQSDCATYVSPYFFTFDPEGTIHKCWETVHDTKKSSGTDVFKRWNPDDFKRYLDYSRTKVHPVCYNCKFNPVCEGLSCAYDTLESLKEEEFPCTPWKAKLPDYFKKMYAMMQERPNEVLFSQQKENELQTHSNK